MPDTYYDYKVVKTALTGGGYGIGVLHYPGPDLWTVIRFGPDNRFITIDRFDSEQDVRAAANAVWRADTQAPSGSERSARPSESNDSHG